MKPFTLALFLLLPATPAFSDSITMYNTSRPVNGGCCDILIPMVPGTEQLLWAVRPNPYGPSTFIDFYATIDTTQTTFSSLSWTFTSALAGSETINFSPSSCSGGSLVYCYGDFGIPTQRSNHGPFPATLTVTLNGTQTQTYNFNYMIPFPEPAPFLLLGTGLLGIGWLKYRAVRRGPES